MRPSARALQSSALPAHWGRRVPAAARLRSCRCRRAPPSSLRPALTALPPPRPPSARPAAAQQKHDAEEAAQFERLKAALAEAPSLRTYIAIALEQTAAAMNAARASITAPVNSGNGAAASLAAAAAPVVAAAPAY